MKVIIFVLVVVCGIFLCFNQKEGLLGKRGYHCPKHATCDCVDQTGKSRGQVRVGLKYHGGGFTTKPHCWIRHRGTVCQKCRSFGKAKQYHLDCSPKGYSYERTHCPISEEVGECKPGDITERVACSEYQQGFFQGCHNYVTGSLDSKRCDRESSELQKVCSSLSSTKCLQKNPCLEFVEGLRHACSKYTSRKEDCFQRAKIIESTC